VEQEIKGAKMGVKVTRVYRGNRVSRVTRVLRVARVSRVARVDRGKLGYKVTWVYRKEVLRGCFYCQVGISGPGLVIQLLLSSCSCLTVGYIPNACGIALLTLLLLLLLHLLLLWVLLAYCCLGSNEDQVWSKRIIPAF
jgi:hypothetical protein